MRKVYITATVDVVNWTEEFYLIFSCDEGFKITDQLVRALYRGRLTDEEKSGQITVERVDEIPLASRIENWQITDSK